jgi:hypothetical protein
MSKEAVNGLLDLMVKSPDLFATSGNLSLEELIALGKQHGFDFTEAEANEAIMARPGVKRTIV